ncbi:hypothetical protein PGB90_008582 [Kerria lacca]
MNLNECSKIIKNTSAFKRRSEEDITKCFYTLKNAGYSNTYIQQHLYLLNVSPNILKNYLLFYKECGFNEEKIGPAIVDIEHIMTVPIYLLKNYSILSNNVNLADNFLFYLGISKMKFDLETNDNESIREVYIKILKMHEILHYDSENIILNLQSSTGIILRETVFEYPRIMKTFGIDSSILTKYPQIIEMDANILMYRILKLINSPTLTIFKDHPKFGSLLISGPKVLERINILQELNMNCYDICLLTCSSKVFFKHILNRADRTKTNDLSIYISRKLGKSFKLTKHELSKNKFFRSISILTVHENVEYLLTMGFSKDEIFSSVQILMYSTKNIETILKKLMCNSIATDNSQKIQVVHKKYFLALTLYYIEKEHNFSGHGIWNETSDKLPDILTNIKLSKK